MPEREARLLPCPFCGGEPVLDNLIDPDDHYVNCTKCEIQTIANYTREQVIARWNTRTETATQAETIAELAPGVLIRGTVCQQTPGQHAVCGIVGCRLETVNEANARSSEQDARTIATLRARVAELEGAVIVTSGIVGFRCLICGGASATDNTSQLHYAVCPLAGASLPKTEPGFSISWGPLSSEREAAVERAGKIINDEVYSLTGWPISRIESESVARAALVAAAKTGETT